MSEYRRGVNDGFKLGLREGRIKAEDEMREQPEQEPVAPLKGWKLNHARKHPDEEGVAEIGYLDPEDDRFAPILTVDTGLYYQDAQALPLAVAILSMLSAHPPRREWQSLTEEEIKNAVLGDPFGGAALMSMMRDGVVVAELRQAVERIARVIEQALKEKNHD
jgi:hypothetical protein